MHKALVVMAALLPFAPAFSSSTLASPAPVKLERVGTWNMNYGYERCALIHSFGPADDPVTISLELYGPNMLADLTVVGQRFATHAAFERVHITLGPGSTPYDRRAIAAKLGKSKTPMFIFGPVLMVGRPADEISTALPRDKLVKGKSFDRISIAWRNKAVELETGTLDKPLAAMRTCLDDMMKRWGLDPAVQDHLSRAPTPIAKPANWLRPEDFPSKPKGEGRNGVVHFRLMIGIDGAPTDCVVQTQTSPADFGQKTCKLLLERARFKPALDGEGKPVTSIFNDSVNWLAGS